MLYPVNHFSPSQREYPIISRMVWSYHQMGYQITGNTFVDLQYDNPRSYCNTFLMKIVSLGANNKIDKVSLTIFETSAQQAG